MIEVIAFIIVFVWLVGLTVWALKVPKQIDEYCGVTARMATNNVSDWFRNHVAMYKHEEAKAEELMPACDREKLAYLLVFV